MNIEFIISFTIIILAIILIFLIYNRKRFYENFVTNPTSFSLYTGNDSKVFDKQMSLYRDTLGDINDFLLVYGCGINLGEVSTSLEELVKSSAKDLYMTPFSVLTNNYQDVNAKIYKLIEDFYDKNNRITIEGQVYVVISQAPFYRDAQNNPISLQYNADNYIFQSTNLMSNTNVESNPILQFNGYVIFNAYDSSSKLISDKEIRKTAVMNIKKNFRQKQKLCFVSCPNHNNLPCGCASQKAPYVSNCLESDNSDIMTAGEKYTYAVLYRINPRFADLIGRQILVVDYNDYDWSPDSLNPIPTKAKPVIPPPSPLDIHTEAGNLCDNLPVATNNKYVLFYQDNQYKGWRSKKVPPGKYTIDQLKCYDVKEDASSYKQKGGMRVKLYRDTDFTQVANEKGHESNLNRFSKYNINDAMKSAEIIDVGANINDPISCSGYNPKGDNAVYRYKGYDKIRWYPSPEIAESWDPNWEKGINKELDCTGFTLGPDMKMRIKK